ncbi:hypothetical protein WJX74_007163 [Apatococcus lobatus]|uniref:Uncharacterized protein n=1 Tax=Apatococcus lobatus TaxID=904363 RepID=A0AAW1RM66_9CHLO
MSSAQVQAEDAKDESKKQIATISSQLSLGAAGAAGTAAGVDGGDRDGVANMTAIMVKMGLLNLVHDIVVKLGTLDRADVTAAVTLGLLNLKEVTVVMQINNALIASGHMSEGAEISKEMLKNGQMQFLDLLKQAGGSWLGGDKKDEQGSDKKEGSWFGKLTGSNDKSGDKPDDKTSHAEKKQDGQSGSWFGSSSSPPDLNQEEGSNKRGQQKTDAGDAGAPSKEPSTVNSVADKVATSINSVADAVRPVKPTEQGQTQASQAHAQQTGNGHPQDDVETRTL